MAEEEKPINKLLALVVVSALAGTGGSLGYRSFDNPRPDPFTGTDGRELEQRCNWRIAQLEKRIEGSERHIYELEREASSWKNRIVRLEEKLND